MGQAIKAELVSVKNWDCMTFSRRLCVLAFFLSYVSLSLGFEWMDGEREGEVWDENWTKEEKRNQESSVGNPEKKKGK